MQLIVSPTAELNGSVRIPGSKSQSVRALLVASLAKGVSTLHALPSGEDVQAAEQVVQGLGATVEALECHGHCVRVTGSGAPLSIGSELYTANSGITTRFVLPILGLSRDPEAVKQVSCGAQMQGRLITSYLESLRKLGLHIETGSKGWPLWVAGTLQGGETEVDGITSQYLSGILLSGMMAQKDTVVRVTHLNERPYVEMTLKWLKDHGIRYEHEQDGDTDTFRIFAGQTYQAMEYTVPGDFSSASTLLAAGVLRGSEIRLQGLDLKDPQGDRRLLDLLKEMGADMEIGEDIVIRGGKPLKGITVDANDIPDMVPTLAILGTQAEGVMRITNVPQARFKETDRIHSMAEGLEKMGAKVEEHEDGLTVYRSYMRGAEVRGYEDHRTVMAFGLAGLLAEGETRVDTAEGINKTYPEFVDHMRSLGAHLQLTND